MAIAFDAVGGGTTTGTSLTYSHTCTGSDRILWVIAYDRIAATTGITGITYNGVAMTQTSNGSQQVPGDRAISTWYLVNPASGANNVVISLASSFIAANSVSYTGAKQSAQPDAVSKGTDTATTQTTGTLTTVANNCWTVFGVKALGATPAAGSGCTQRASANGMYIFDSNAPITPAGSTSMVSTGGVSASWGWMMESFSPSISVSSNMSSHRNFISNIVSI